MTTRTRTRALAAGFAVGGLLIVTACDNSQSRLWQQVSQ